VPVNWVTDGARRVVKNGLARAGLEVSRSSKRGLDPEVAAIIRDVRPYTMTSPSRVAALCEGVRYIHRNAIPGAIVECGVWRGGSTMAVAQTLLNLNVTDRDLYLFDTFEGMTEPTSADHDLTGRMAADLLQSSDQVEVWCRASLHEVQRNLGRVTYPQHRLHCVEGREEDTVPGRAPDQIALLRLDTDWYESTKHELEHLVPRLSDYGVLIIDDYGHWQGARRAVDEWMTSLEVPVFLNRIDYSGRLAIVGPGERPRHQNSAASTQAAGQ